MYNQSPRRHNIRGELPRASAASLFDQDMNNGAGLNQFNQVQFDSFVNEQPQSDQLSSAMSLPSFPQTVPPPSDSRSGPPSLDGNMPSNPYRSKGRGGRTRQYNTASSLFGAVPQQNIPDTQSANQFYSANQSTKQTNTTFQPNSAQNNVDAVPMDNFFQPTKSELLQSSQEPTVMPVSQPEGFAEYESSKISAEKIKQAEEENDRLRAEKIAKRAETIERIHKQRESRIAEQEKQKAQINLANSFQNEASPLTLTTKPKSKEERKEIRERARKARQKRSEKGAQPPSGDLSSLIDEVSSRGNSICSDLSLDQLNSNQLLNTSHNNPILVNYPQTNETFSNSTFHPNQTTAHVGDNFATYPNQPPPASNIESSFMPSQSVVGHPMQPLQHEPSPLFQNQHNDVVHPEQPQNIHNTTPNTWTMNHFPSDPQSQFFDQIGQNSSIPENRQPVAVDYHQDVPQPQNSNLETETNEQLYMHYDYSGSEYTDTKEDKSTNIQEPRTAEEIQSGGSSGSGSSYAMVASVKSSESDSRLSPYQFVDSTIYPSQSSLNSNESSPLEIQNVSSTSTYDKVSLPSGTMSSFEITSGSSSDIPLHSTSSMIEAIEEASEPLPEPVKDVIPPKEENPVLQNKKKLQQKAAALFQEAKQINQQASESSSRTQLLEYQSNFSSPSSPNPTVPLIASTRQSSHFFNEGHPLYQPQIETNESDQNLNEVVNTSNDQLDGPSRMIPEASVAAIEQNVATQSSTYQYQPSNKQPPELISNPSGIVQQHYVQSPPDVVPSGSVTFQNATQIVSERVDQPEVLQSHGNITMNQEFQQQQQQSPPFEVFAQHQEDNHYLPTAQPELSQEAIPDHHSLSPRNPHQIVNQSHSNVQQDASHPTALPTVQSVNTGVENLSLCQGVPVQTNQQYPNSVTGVLPSNSVIPSSSQHLINTSVQEQPPFGVQSIHQTLETSSNHQTAGQPYAHIGNPTLYSEVVPNTQPKSEEVTAPPATHHLTQNLFQATPASEQTLDLTKKIYQGQHGAISEMEDMTQLTTQQQKHPQSLSQPPQQQQQPLYMTQPQSSLPAQEPLKSLDQDASTEKIGSQQSVIDELFGRSAPKPKEQPTSQIVPQSVQPQVCNIDTQLKGTNTEQQNIQPAQQIPTNQESDQSLFTQQLTTALINHQQTTDLGLTPQPQQGSQLPVLPQHQLCSTNDPMAVQPNMVQQVTTPHPQQQQSQVLQQSQQQQPALQQQQLQLVQQQQSQQLQQQVQQQLPQQQQVLHQQQGLQQPQIMQQPQQQSIHNANENLAAPQVTTPVNTVAPVNPFQTPTSQQQQQQGVYNEQPAAMYPQPATPTSTMTQEQQNMMTQYYQQMGYTPQQISMMLQQYQYDPTGSMQSYGNDFYSQMWYQQQQQYMQQMYYYNYWQAAYSSYPSSVASSAYGDSRPGSVIERRSSRSSDRGLSEIGDLTSELSFQNRSASPVQEEIVKQRSTPLSFTRPHIKAIFSKTGGILNVVAPRQPLDGEIAVVQNVSIENIVAIPLLKRFPGPLLRGDTNKKQINNFIVETIRVHLPKLYGDNKHVLFAHIALWEFVGLLVKQNGTFDGSDVADMLINLLPTTQSSDGRDYKGFSTLCNPQHVPNGNAVEEMQLLLATGRAKDGLDHAIQSGLWGHAFMLGSLMGHKYLGAVQNKFSATIKRTDPMKTLYTHLANKDPVSIKKRVNADTWVQNLCMLISQPTNHSENDRQKLVCFGDALRDLGLVAASHLCYLIANEAFGCHKDGDSRMVLLGQEHKTYTDKRANVWIDPLHVQLTEIYQYARTLHKKDYVIPNFQQYKYEYAMQLLEYGHLPQALAYLESIGEAVTSDQSYQLYNKELCNNIIKHANRIVLQETERYEGFQSPDWVKKIEAYACNANYIVPSQQKTTEAPSVPSFKPPDFINDPSSSTEPPFSPVLPDTSRSDDISSDVIYHGNNDTRPNEAPYFQPVQNQQYVEEETTSSWQQNDYNEQSAWEQQETNDVDQVDNRFQNEAVSYNYQSTNYTEGDNDMVHSDTQIYGTEGQMYDNDGYSYQHEQGQGFPQQQTDGEHFTQHDQQSPEDIREEEGGVVGGEQQMFQSSYPSNQSNDMPTAPTFFNPSQTTSTFGAPYQQTFTKTTDEPSAEVTTSTQQTVDEVEEEEEDLFGGFKKNPSDDRGTQKSGSQEKSKESVKKEEPKIEAAKPASGGMFQTIKGLFSRKEVYLPDDTDKSLVYDKEKKRWVDKNADPNDEPAPPPPPPTGGFGMGARATPSAATPVNASITAASSMPTPMSASPPSHGMAGPGFPGLSRRNLSKKSSNTEIMPQMDSAGSTQIQSEPTEQTMRIGSKTAGRRTLLEQSMDKKEEDKKPTGPPSMFSLKAQGGRRGLNRYATTPGSISTKSTPMAPVLDPFGKGGSKAVNGNAPGNMAFFTPGAPQKAARRLDQN